jgi:cysteine desulfurase family protein (TIGR01976 family)
MTVKVSEKLDLSAVREEFPALALEVAGRKAVYFDNPGGTQVHRSVIDAMTNYYRTSNSNTGGAFATSQRSDEIIQGAREAMADLLNAPSPSQIIFGPNMTTLTFNLARAFGRTIKPGDEIVVTGLDHDANVAPWLTYEEQGAVIKVVDINVPECTLNMDSLRAALSEKTRLVAVTAASNATGTFPDVAEVVKLAHSAGAKVFIDAVQCAPHSPLDVQALDCDFLACSAYKFFGPHQGILYGKWELLEELKPYKVRPASNETPYKWETGTQSHEGMAGTAAAVEYFASVGRRFGQNWREEYEQAGFSGRRLELKMGLAAVYTYEQRLGEYLLSGLRRFEDMQIYGITDPAKFEQRGPTVAFTWARLGPRETAEFLGQRGIFVWDGNYYALNVMERLGLEGEGGAVRIGPAHYNTFEEIDYLLDALDDVR